MDTQTPEQRQLEAITRHLQHMTQVFQSLEEEDVPEYDNEVESQGSKSKKSKDNLGVSNSRFLRLREILILNFTLNGKIKLRKFLTFMIILKSKR